MVQFSRLEMAVVATALAIAFPAIAQNQYQSQTPAAPSSGATQGASSVSGEKVPGARGSGSSSEDGYPTAVQCAQAQGQAQARPGAELAPNQRRILEQCERMGSQTGAASGATETPSGRIPR